MGTWPLDSRLCEYVCGQTPTQKEQSSIGFYPVPAGGVTTTFEERRNYFRLYI